MRAVYLHEIPRDGVRRQTVVYNEARPDGVPQGASSDASLPKLERVPKTFFSLTLSFRFFEASTESR